MVVLVWFVLTFVAMIVLLIALVSIVMFLPTSVSSFVKFLVRLSIRCELLITGFELFTGWLKLFVV